MRREEFVKTIEQIKTNNTISEGIGTYKERFLHRTLKYFLMPDEEKHEVKIGPYICDIFDNGKIIEIQTSNFNKMRPKLNYLLEHYPLKIIYPIAHIKFLTWEDKETKSFSKQRKSPKQGSCYDAFRELYKIKTFLSNTNLSITIMLIDVLEHRLLDGWSKDKKKGSNRKELYPLKLDSTYDLNSLEDYYRLIPQSLIEPFNTRDFAKASKLSPRRASEAISVLKSLNIISFVRKQNRYFYYEIVEKNKLNEEMK